MCKGGSIAFAEIGFMEALCKNYRLSKMFIVENAFEWGTLALALMNLDARVVTIDYCAREQERRGF